MVVFDATMLSMLLRPGTRAPLDPATGATVEHAEPRIADLVARLQKARTVIIIPTPALSELLVKTGAAGPGLLQAIQKSSSFRIEGFDIRAAVELAQMTNDLATGSDKRAGIDAPWTKIKFDRQIVAIARVHRATAIYTDDDKLIAFAALNEISCVRLADLPIPIPPSKPNCRSIQTRAPRRRKPKMAGASHKQTISDQAKRFIKAAREAGCSEDEAEIRENMRRVVRASPRAAAVENSKNKTS